MFLHAKSALKKERYQKAKNTREKIGSKHTEFARDISMINCA